MNFFFAIQEGHCQFDGKLALKTDMMQFTVDLALRYQKIFLDNQH